RERQRQTLFADLDKRWDDKSLFKSLSDDIQAADLHITPTELVLIQVGVAVGAALIMWAISPFPPLAFVLPPPGFIAGIIAVPSYVRFMGRRRVTRFEDQLPNNLAILAGSGR